MLSKGRMETKRGSVKPWMIVCQVREGNNLLFPGHSTQVAELGHTVSFATGLSLVGGRSDRGTSHFFEDTLQSKGVFEDWCGNGQVQCVHQFRVRGLERC